MAKFYFTFGCDERFPFGLHEFVEIEANDQEEARSVFNAVWPPREGSSFLNCSMVYDEAQWKSISEKYYKGVEPSAVGAIWRRPNGQR